MKKIIYTAGILIAGTILNGCKDNGSGPAEANTTPPAEYDTVLVAKGREAAAEALSYREGSMEREMRILDIRAAEERLRSAGMTRSADSYHAGAAALLDSLQQPEPEE